jgi:mannosyltransferase OCH1-like enzyme
MIPKNIHIAWMDKAVLDTETEHPFIDNCIKKLVRLSRDWTPQIHDDADIDQYLLDNLDRTDYIRLKDKHIVEKSDVWRLVKLFNEGGLYTDIDRLCNTPLSHLINDNTRCILPICAEHDFSQDFMCSAPNNPIFYEALKLNLERRYRGATSVYYLGPQTYFHAVTKTLFGEILDKSTTPNLFVHIRAALAQMPFVVTYREEPPYNLITYRPEYEQVTFDHEIAKRDFYKMKNLKHWTGEW